MLTYVISVILFIIGTISLTHSIIIATSSIIARVEDYYSLMWLMVSLIAFLVGTLLFYHKTGNFPLNDKSEYHEKEFKELLTKNLEYYTIHFVKVEKFWVCENNQKIVKLDLSGYPFQKAYLISYVVRNLRYNKISLKLPLKFLFKNTFPLGKNINIKLIITDRDKTFEKTIVKNGISRYGFLARIITRAPYALTYWTNESHRILLREKSYIDERKYEHF